MDTLLLKRLQIYDIRPELLRQCLWIATISHRLYLLHSISQLIEPRDAAIHIRFGSYRYISDLEIDPFSEG